MTLDEIDKSELILESYRIQGIGASECRSIFLDWVLKLGVDIDQNAAINYLIARYAKSAPDHPMTEVLQAALRSGGEPARRGGHAGRVGR